MPTARRTPGSRKRFAPRIVPAGDSAVMLELGDELDLEANAAAQRVAGAVRSAALDGVTDVVAAIVTVTVHFDAADAAQAAARRDAIGDRLLAALTPPHVDDVAAGGTMVEIPVCYAMRYAPDLEAVATATGLAADEVVRLHVGSSHRVLMIGFAPGFPYIGGLDPRLSVPRRATPRPRLDAGSVAIANGQTAVYPFATPGGWNIIGRTPLRLFDAARTPATLLQAGDRVVFRPITALEFDRLATEPERR